MTHRPDLPPAGPGPEARPGSTGTASAIERAAERRSLPWWRLRTWRKDVEALTRLRDGLREMELDSALGAEPEVVSAGTLTPETVSPETASPETANAATPGTLTSAPGVLAAPLGLRAPGSGAADLAAADQTVPGLTAPEVGSAALLAQPDGVADAAAPGPASDLGGGAGTSGSGTLVSAHPDPAIASIRDTFAHVATAGDEAVGYFYAWLFLRRPQLRDLFPPAMDEQRDRLFASLARIVESLSTPDEMASYLSQLGRDHRKYGVDPGMYDAVGEALIATLRAFAESAFTPAAEEAWAQTYAAAAALMIRAAEDDAAVAPASWTAEVVQVDNRGRDIAMLTLAPDRVLPYQAGQHLTLQTPRWPHVWRPYSIACHPRADGLITLHVKAVPGGWVSTALVHHTEPGDELTLGPALGTMTLQHAADRDLLCIAGGTGLAPIKAIIEQVVRAPAARQRQVFLFYGARKRNELYDIKDLWRLTDAYHGLQLTPVTSDDPAFTGMQGNVSRVAARYLPHRDCEAYVAGPAAMVREAIRVLTRTGMPRERIHYDDALLAARQRVGSGT
ncbi:MAG TPA: globin domain-containing protein [Streptosporangiaceae bacterium]|nr:globin domain-containing protein [Streptosporangiaceae bacterium]